MALSPVFPCTPLVVFLLDCSPFYRRDAVARPQDRRDPLGAFDDPFDPWTVACVLAVEGNEDNCSDPRGPDYDFGQGAILYKIGKKELLGAGQKSGVYWAVNPDNGEVIWSRQVGPGGSLGGLQWGSATDGKRIYTAISNNSRTAWTLPNGQVTNAGLWSRSIRPRARSCGRPPARRP
jgi:hypothetical protein